VRADGRADDGVGLDQQAQQVFVADIRLPLVGVDWDGPSSLAGDDGFIVPIRASDQPDGYGRSSGPCPVDQLAHIAFAIPEVSLDSEAIVGGIAIRGLHQGLLEHLQRQVLDGVVLHVDVDEDSERAGEVENGPQPRLDRLRAGFRGRGLYL
jgi:hypothetical protein